MSDERRDVPTWKAKDWETATSEELDAGYCEMAAHKEAEAEAREWYEALIGDVGDEEW